MADVDASNSEQGIQAPRIVQVRIVAQSSRRVFVGLGLDVEPGTAPETAALMARSLTPEALTELILDAMRGGR